MYGYISIYFKPSEEERRNYLYHYCGMCHNLKANFGNLYRPTIIKEVVLFSIMQNETKDIKEFKCPWMKFGTRYRPNQMEFLDKYSYLNLLIIYGKLIDYKLEGYPISLKFLKKIKEKLSNEYDNNFLCEYEKLMEYQDEIEKSRLDIDFYAKPTQLLMNLLFKKFFNAQNATLPVSIGTLIYIVDSIYDFSKDIKRKKFNAISNSFNIKDLQELEINDKERLLFTYDLCSMDIMEEYEKYTLHNKHLVKKLLSFSINYHRYKITSILNGGENNERCEKQDIKWSI
jgi:hypothetical protein